MSVAKAAFKVITSYFIMETLLGLDALTPHLGADVEGQIQLTMLYVQ